MFLDRSVCIPSTLRYFLIYMYIVTHTLGAHSRRGVLHLLLCYLQVWSYRFGPTHQMYVHGLLASHPDMLPYRILHDLTIKIPLFWPSFEQVLDPQDEMKLMMQR